MDAMTLAAILRACPTTNRFFAGCFASNRLPEGPGRMRRWPLSLAVNSEPSNNVVSGHWSAVFAYNPSEVFYFCPLGRSPRGFIKRWLSRFPNVRWNSIPFQKRITSTCGLYVIYMVYELSNGKHYDEVIKELNDMTVSDMYISQFIKKKVLGHSKV